VIARPGAAAQPTTTTSTPFQWVEKLASAGEDEGFGVAIDGEGNVDVTGRTAATLPGSPEPNAGGYDAFVAQFDSGGTLRWVHQLGSSGLDEAHAVVVDAAGNIDIAGYSDGTLPGSAETNAGNTDAFVAQYDSGGNRQWVHELGTSGADQALGLALDRAGYLDVTGWTMGTLPGSADSNAGDADLFVAQYDSTGNRTWVHQFGSRKQDIAYAAAVDSAGDIDITGETYSTLPGSPEPNAGKQDVFVVQYGSAGNRRWVHQLGSGSFDLGFGIAVDASDNVDVTGYSSGTLPGAPEGHIGKQDVFAAQ
jgi:hypothetical protein